MEASLPKTYILGDVSGERGCLWVPVTDLSGTLAGLGHPSPQEGTSSLLPVSWRGCCSAHSVTSLNPLTSSVGLLPQPAFGQDGRRPRIQATAEPAVRSAACAEPRAGPCPCPAQLISVSLTCRHPSPCTARCAWYLRLLNFLNLLWGKTA